MKKNKKIQVGIIMGSDSDLPLMKAAADTLSKFSVKHEVTIVSAHRTPDRLVSYCQSAHKRGLKVLIAAAGGAAHLPGMAAAISPLPVIGVPVKSSNSIAGLDSLLSIAQMPSGVPVATVAVNGAVNAGILAAQILYASDARMLGKIIKYKQSLNKSVIDKVRRLKNSDLKSYLRKMSVKKS